ncbi:MAG TPA: nuclear transport factor 2 family protein [Terriglobales bacterium]|nr:nuclear transport factor 2 family protein [Terriglobales bacterium]
MYRPYPGSVGGSTASSDVESTIRGLTQDFRMNFNTGNYDQVAALFASDGMFLAPHQEPVTGNRPIERKLREFGDSGFQDLRLETTRVENSGDMAMEVGRYSVSIFSDARGKQTDEGKYLTVWRRLGAWRIAAACWSSSLRVEYLVEERTGPAKDNVTVISEVPKSA